MAEIGAAGGVGPARLAVMARAPEPRAFILGRLGDRPAGAAFAALHGGVAMLHAVEVAPFARRQGLATAIAAAAAAWGLAHGAPDLRPRRDPREHAGASPLRPVGDGGGGLLPLSRG